MSGSNSVTDLLKADEKSCLCAAILLSNYYPCVDYFLWSGLLFMSTQWKKYIMGPSSTVKTAGGNGLFAIITLSFPFTYCSLIRLRQKKKCRATPAHFPRETSFLGCRGMQKVIAFWLVQMFKFIYTNIYLATSHVLWILHSCRLLFTAALAFDRFFTTLSTISGISQRGCPSCPDPNGTSKKTAVSAFWCEKF